MSRARRLGPARVVGLSFDDQELRAVEFKRGRGRKRSTIVRAGTVPLGPEVVDHGEIVDCLGFSGALRELWREHGFGTKNVAVGLDGRTTVIRQADLPALEPDELAQAAAYEIGELLSYPLEEAVISTVEIGRRDLDGTEMVRTVTLATRQDGLMDLHDAVKQAGLRPVATELVASSLVEAIEEVRQDEDGVGAMVHVSPTITIVLVHDERGLAFSRVINAGLAVGETSLSDELEMELAMLAGYAGDEPGSPSDPEAVSDGPSLATVVEGIRRTLHYYTTEVDERPVRRIVLCGPQSGVGGLAAAVGKSIPDVAVLRQRFPGFPEGIDEVPAYTAAASVAIAASRGVRDRRRFDLTPTVLRERRAARRRTVAGITAAAILVPMLIADAVGRRGATSDEAAEADAVELSVDALRTELVGFDEDRRLLVDAQGATERVNELRDQELGFPTLLRRVAESMPEDTFLISFRLSRAKSDELPTGYSGEPPPATFALTGVAGDLDGVGRWIQTVDKVPVVEGLWMTQSAFGPYGATDRLAAVFTIDGAVVGPAEPVALLGGIGLDEAAE